MPIFLPERRSFKDANGNKPKFSIVFTNADFGLSSTVLLDALPSGQALLGLLDLPGTYSRLIGGLREPIANSKGLLSILARTTVATRGDLIDSIERQLSRPFGQGLRF
jgi:hypothetical protein